MRSAIRASVVTLCLLLVAAPATGKPGAAPKKKCSAAGMATRSLLPVKIDNKAVARTRDQIMGAAVGCDIPRLAKLAAAGTRRFDFTFGTETKPAMEWSRREKAGHQILAKLVKILRLHPGREGEKWVWPAAFTENATDEDWEEISHLFGDRDVALFKRHTGYTGPRTAITSDGEWLYFIDGD